MANLLTSTFMHLPTSLQAKPPFEQLRSASECAGHMLTNARNKAQSLSIMGHVGSVVLRKMQSMAIGVLVPDQSSLKGPSTTWILLEGNGPFKWGSPEVSTIATVGVLARITLPCGAVLCITGCLQHPCPYTLDASSSHLLLSDSQKCL